MADFDDIIGSAEEILARTEALGKYEATQQRILERLGLIANAQSRILELEQERDSAREAFQQREKNLKDLVQERMELEREFRRAQREGDRVVIDALQQSLDAQQELVLRAQRNVSEAAKKFRVQDNLKIVGDKAKSATEEIVTMATGITNMGESSDSLDKILFRTAKGELGFAEMSEAIGVALDTVLDLTDPVNLAANAMKYAYEATLAVAAANVAAAKDIDNAIVAFNRATGVVGDYNNVLSDLSDNLLSVGISAQDSIRGFQTVFEEVRSFADLTRGQQIQISETVALLDRMGFSADSQAKNILFLTKSMGASEVQAAEFNTQLMSIAQSLDMPIGKLVQGFEEAKTILGASAQGSAQLAQQFGQLAAQADATNLSIGKLVGIAEKFDTFESAAQQVGLLNAMLGGPFLSTLEMVSATNPSERIEMLSDALQRAGKSFDDMSYYERKAIADAAGLADVNDLALLMSGNLDSLTGPELSADEIIEMKEQMKEFNDLTTSMSNALMATVVSFAPLVRGISELFSTLAGFISDVFAPFREGLMDGFSIGEQMGYIFQNLVVPAVEVLAFLAKAVLVPAFGIIAGIVEGLLLPFTMIAGAIDYISTGISELIESSTILQGIVAAISFVFDSLVTGLELLASGIGIVLGGILAILAAQAAYAAISIPSIFTTFMGPAGFLIGSALAATAIGAAYSLMTADDFMSPGEGSGGYGDRVILGPEGAFALNNRDTVVAGTNLTQNSVVNNSTTNAPAVQQAAGPSGPINMNIVLSIDGTEIKTVVNSVKVDPTVNANLYNSIAKLITRGDGAR